MLVFQTFFGVAYVNGTSMQPLFDNGDILIVKKWSAPQKGDVVTAYIEELDCVVVKRIVATSGDYVTLKDDGVYINDEFLMSIANTGAGTGIDMIVPENHYFLMGDNENNSLDSRELGCVGKNNIQGVVIEKYGRR